MAAVSGTFIKCLSINSLHRALLNEDSGTFPPTMRLSKVDPKLLSLMTLSILSAGQQSESDYEKTMKNHLFAILNDALLPIGKRVKSIKPESFKISVKTNENGNEKDFYFKAQEEITITTERSDLITTIPRLFTRMLLADTAELTLTPNQSLIFTNVSQDDIEVLSTFTCADSLTGTAKITKEIIPGILEYISSFKPLWLKKQSDLKKLDPNGPEPVITGVEILSAKPWTIQFLAVPSNRFSIQSHSESPLTFRIKKGFVSQPAVSKETLPMRVKESFSTDIEGQLREVFNSGKFSKKLLALRDDKVGVVFNPKKKVIQGKITLKEHVTLITEKPLSTEFRKRIIDFIELQKFTHELVWMPTIRDVPTLKELKFE